MTLRELLESGIVIEGYKKIQCWEYEDNPTIYHEGYDFGDLKEYLDRKVVSIFPYNPTPTEAAICIDLEEMKKMDDKVRYCYSWDGEDYFGDYTTEEEALEDARSEALHEEVYIGTCTEPELRWYRIEEMVIEQIEENLYEDVGEHAKSFEVSTEAENELMLRLDAAIEGWIKDMNIKAGCYQVFDVHRIPIEEV